MSESKKTIFQAGITEGPTTSDDPMDDAMNVNDGITMKREADPLDDYNGQSDALYDAFWPVFLLLRGLRQGKALPAPKYRHLMTYYDNRFAQDMGLLFCSSSGSPAWITWPREHRDAARGEPCCLRQGLL